MASFEFLAIILTGLGFTASMFYYASILRNANKTRELQLQAQEQATETRKIAVYNNYVDKITTKDYITSYLNLMYNQEWDSFDDWWEKYGAKNPSAYNDFIYVMWWFQNIGMLFDQGVIEIEMLYFDRGFALIRMWKRLEEIVKGYRDQIDNQYAFYHVELLYHELIKFETTLESRA